MEIELNVKETEKLKKAIAKEMENQDEDIDKLWNIAKMKLLRSSKESPEN